MAVREQLEGKTLRRVVVPIPVADVGSARQRVDEARQLLDAANASGLPGDTAAVAQAALDEAQRDLEASVAEIVLVSRGYADAETIQARYTRDDTGGVDYEGALPAFLALLCEDETLRDQDWWITQLQRPEWTPGDVSGLILGVMHLVADVVRPLVPKG